MSSTRGSGTDRAVVDDVFGRDTRREIWSGNYKEALPISVQNFDLTVVLPAVFYMFRRSYRRGKGKFLDVFGEPSAASRQSRRIATVERVATKLAESANFEGL